MKVDIYPVGWLAALLRARSCWGHRWLIPQGPREALRTFRRELRYDIQQARAGNWRAVKNSFNGYLAEPDEFPPGDYRRRCGSGWTRRRALRSLHRRLPPMASGSSPSGGER